MSARNVNLLIVGAGPYGLAMAACAADLGIDHEIVGEPMAFWRHHMPAGMYLRSASDWHLDPVAVDTLEEYVSGKGKKPRDVQPIPHNDRIGQKAVPAPSQAGYLTRIRPVAEF